MKLTNLLPTLILTLTTLLIPTTTRGVLISRNLPAGLESPLKGYAVFEPVLSGTILGQDFKLNGTVQQVYTQLEQVHGVEKFAAAIAQNAANIKNAASLHRNNDTSIRKRDERPPPLCIPVLGQPWRPAPVGKIDDNVRHLQSIGGTFYVRARHCGRIACEQQTGIWLCNDAMHAIRPDNGYLASDAEDIRYKCQKFVFWHWWTGFIKPGGQLFDTDDYNVIVRDDLECDTE